MWLLNRNELCIQVYSSSNTHARVPAWMWLWTSSIHATCGQQHLLRMLHPSFYSRCSGQVVERSLSNRDAFPDSPTLLVMFHHTDAILPYIFHNTTTAGERFIIYEVLMLAWCPSFPPTVNYDQVNCFWSLSFLLHYFDMPNESFLLFILQVSSLLLFKLLFWNVF